MKFFRYIISTMVVIGALSVGALADEQKKGQKPPKQPTDVEQPKKQPPPPPRDRDNRGGNEERDRGKSDNRRGRP